MESVLPRTYGGQWAAGRTPEGPDEGNGRPPEDREGPGGRAGFVRIRTLLGDGHQVFREALEIALEREGDFEVIGAAESGPEVVAEARRLEPDVVVTEVCLPGLSGIEATREILREDPRGRVLILSSRDGSSIVREALRAGALGYVLKGSPLREVFDAIRAVSRAKSFLSTAITRDVITAFTERSPETEGLEALTVREREVLLGIAEGFGSKEIAERLHVSPRTVESHRTNLMRKLGAHKVSELVRRAIREGLLEP